MMALDNNAKPDAATNEHCLNRVLESLARLLGEHRAEIIDANSSDLAACPRAWSRSATRASAPAV